MTPERFREIEKLFNSALEREPSQRAAFLQEVCAGDPSLQRQVEVLVASHEQEPSFLESPTLRVTVLLTEDEADFMVGRRIGPYEVLREIGRGGMGEVYLAQDKRLGRQVALKFLPVSFQDDPDRRARLLSEARASSSLHSPHIAAIHDIGEHEGRAYIVMEYVEGEPLSQKLKGGPLALSEAIDLGMQIAEALEEAHERGIIHRDIKSSNLMVTPRGQVKVLDFGLAKVTQRLAGDKEQEESRLTQPEETASGIVMGTVHYMSPEQARGLRMDARTDLFSLGVVLYEMVAGRVPFDGDTSSDVLAAILEHEPEPLGHDRPEVPAELERIVRRCLEKDRERRYQSATELLIDLKNLKRDSDSVAIPAVRRRRLAVSIVVALTLVAVAAASAWLWLRSGHPTPASRSDYVQLTNFPDSVTQPALSTDGRMLTFIRGPGTFYTPGQIYVKLLPEGEPVQLTRDSLQKMSPVFSPDGSRIAYTVVGDRFNWDTWIVSVLGGEPRKWLPNASGLVWMNQRMLLFSEIKKGQHMAIVAAEESRMNSRNVYVPPKDRGMGHRSYPSPDGKWALVVEMDERGWLPCRLVPMDSSSPGRPVGPPDAGCTFAAWSPDAKWMYFSSGVGGAFHTWRQQFPDGNLEQTTSGPTEEEGIAMAPDGRSCVTSVGLRQRPIRLHEGGDERQISLEGYAYQPKLSPDGKRVYYRILKDAVPRFGRSELWVADLESGRNEPLLPGFLVTGYDLSADGQKVAMSTAERDGKQKLWVAQTDRRSAPRQIPGVEGGQEPLFGTAGEIFFRALEGASGFACRVREDGTGLRKVTAYPVRLLLGLSPDARWLVVFSQAPGGEETIVLLAHPVDGGPPVRISAYDLRVKWSPDGRLIFISWGRSGMGAYAMGRTYVVPLPPGRMLPEIPAAGFRSEDELARLPGVQIIEAADVAPGATPQVYAYSRETVQRNLYRIPLP
jgi:serine/threonine protein kinase